MVYDCSISVVTPTCGQLLDFTIMCNTALHYNGNIFHALMYIRIFNKSRCMKSDISDEALASLFGVRGS